MRVFLRNLTVVKKFTLLLALLTVIFVGIMIFSINTTTSVREQHRYIAYQLVERNALLTRMQVEVRALGILISATFNNAVWLAQTDADGVLAMNEEVRRRAGLVLELGEEYLRSISEDGYIYDIVGSHDISMALANMSRILLIMEDIYDYYRIPSGVFNPQEDPPFAPVAPRFATPAVDAIEEVRDMNLSAIRGISERLYLQQARYLSFNLVAFFFTITLIFLISAPTIIGLKTQMEQIEVKAQAIKRGDFNVTMHSDRTDEIGRLSNLMGDMVGVFSAMISQIIKTAGDIGRGKLDCRLEETDFQGDFRLAAASVNMLARKVVEAADEKAKEEYYSHMQFLMDTVPLVVGFWDENLKLITANDEAKRRYNLADKREYIDNFFELSPLYQPDGRLSSEAAIEHLNRAMAEGFAKFEWMHQDIGGNPIPSEIECHKILLMGKAMLLTYATDLRYFHKAVKEAERSALAEENSQAKSRFLARMSHEIRTPISAVLGIAEIQLQSPSLPPAVEESFAKIYNSAQILLGIINDILDLSKIESGKMEILDAEYQAASLINDVVQLNLFRMGSKKIKFDVDISDNIPVFMHGDELRIKQIASNILSNAFKYTEEGKVSLDIKFLENGSGEGAPQGASELYFKISDTGCGMSEEDLAGLFSEFSRFNESRNRHLEGTGLGMAIVDNLARLMGANLKIKSAVAVGTTIEVRIPQKRVSFENLDDDMLQQLKGFSLFGNFASKKMTFTPDPMPYGHVLVVDDVETNLFVAKGLLAFYSLKVETTDSGQKAVDLVKAGNAYDIIFMDQMMPGMDGVEATRLIREWGYKNPVVALTANALIGQAEHFMQNGFDGFISKPIDSTHLNSILNKFIRDRQPTEVVEAARKNAKQQERVNNEMREFEVEMRAEFARGQKKAAAEMRDAFSKGDFAACRRIAHTLKGLARTIRENDLGNLASKLEGIFETGEAEEAGELIDALEEKLALVVRAIRAEQGLPHNGSGGPPAEGIDVAKTLEDLEPFLKDSDVVGSLEIAKRLKSLPQAAILIRQIEVFDFEAALTSLPFMKELAV